MENVIYKGKNGPMTARLLALNEDGTADLLVRAEMVDTDGHVVGGRDMPVRGAVRDDTGEAEGSWRHGTEH